MISAGTFLQIELWLYGIVCQIMRLMHLTLIYLRKVSIDIGARKNYFMIMNPSYPELETVVLIKLKC